MFQPSFYFYYYYCRWVSCKAWCIVLSKRKHVSSVSGWCSVAAVDAVVGWYRGRVARSVARGHRCLVASMPPRSFPCFDWLLRASCPLVDSELSMAYDTAVKYCGSLCAHGVLVLHGAATDVPGTACCTLLCQLCCLGLHTVQPSEVV